MKLEWPLEIEGENITVTANRRPRSDASRPPAYEVTIRFQNGERTIVDVEAGTTAELEKSITESGGEIMRKVIAASEARRFLRGERRPRPST